jgi:type II secretory pathway pseudopilin PulG
VVLLLLLLVVLLLVLVLLALLLLLLQVAIISQENSTLVRLNTACKHSLSRVATTACTATPKSPQCLQ